MSTANSTQVRDCVIFSAPPGFCEVVSLWPDYKKAV
jgi:hypothetical protein